MMCCTNGPLGELFLIAQKFVFLETLLETFPHSHSMGGNQEEKSKNLRLVPRGSRDLHVIWGISGCCLTPEDDRSPSGRAKDFNS